MKHDPLNRTKVKRGTELPQAKLTEHDVKMINALVSDRNAALEKAKALTNAKLAEKFGVHKRTIDRITTGENWSHV